MKRQSKAEEALKKQFKITDQRIADFIQVRDAITEQIKASLHIRNQLDNEVGKLESEQLKASQSRKP